MKCTKPNCDCAAIAEKRAGHPIKHYPCLNFDYLELKRKRGEQCDLQDKLIIAEPHLLFVIDAPDANGDTKISMTDKNQDHTLDCWLSKEQITLIVNFLNDKI